MSKFYVKEKKVDESKKENNNEEDQFSSVDKVKANEAYVSTEGKVKTSPIGPAKRVEPTFSDSGESGDEDEVDDNAYGDSNDSGHEEFEPLTEEEMEAELDRIEAEEKLEEDSVEQEGTDSPEDSHSRPPKDDKTE